MAQATFHFPRGFLWGTATSAHQVEGNNTNNTWWAWEQEPGRIKEGHKSGLACEWWGGRWRDDFDRAADAGQNAHRLSVEWSRIQPTPDRWDESALDHYREMLRGLADRNMTPLVTLHHFADPIWFAKLGGWENPDCVDYFVAYVSKTVEALRELCNLWVTINEPNLVAVNGYLLGDFPPGKNDLGLTLRVLVNLIRAHAAAYRAIHSLQPVARAGIALHYRGFEPYRSWFPPDAWAARTISLVFNQLFPRALSTGVIRSPILFKRIPEAKGTQDYFGLNYYTRDQVTFAANKPAGLFANRFYLPEDQLSDGGFIANVPAGIFKALDWARSFKIPIIITENGVNDAGDTLRPRYLVQHLHQVWRAVNFNWPVKGYFHWTLVDNFEWERGWTQRFGLWELEAETQSRRKRPSADLYAEICHENGISSDMVDRYTAELSEAMFPG